MVRNGKGAPQTYPNGFQTKSISTDKSVWKSLEDMAIKGESLGKTLFRVIQSVQPNVLKYIHELEEKASSLELTVREQEIELTELRKFREEHLKQIQSADEVKAPSVADIFARNSVKAKG